MTNNELIARLRVQTQANKSYNKVFGVGAGKTATTTLEQIFRLIGLKTPNQGEQEIRIVKQLYAGNFQPLIEFVSQFDAFQDKPFCTGMTYAQVDALFPGSKFILTVRDPEQWFNSVCSYNLKRLGLTSTKEITREFLHNRMLYLYKNYTYENSRRAVLEVGSDFSVHENWDKLYDKDSRIRDYQQRNNDIIKYFHGREDALLVIDLTSEKNVSRILEFLGIPTEFNFPVPHMNSTVTAKQLV